MQVLFIQGAGANVHDDWDRKLVESLQHELGPTYDVRYPRMPNEAEPSSASWNPALQQELETLDDGAILVGHSVGGTLLIHFLAVHDFKPAALVLIAAPFIGPGGWPSDDLQPRAAFNLRCPVMLFHGSDDKTVPPAHVQLYARAIPEAAVTVLSHRDHQLNNDLADVARSIRAIGPRH